MAARTREKIITAATKLFSAHGYASVSTIDIAKEAGVNEATLFRQFGEKRKLFMAVIDDQAKNTLSLDEINAILKNDQDFESAIMLFAESLMSRITPEYVRLTLALALEIGDRDLSRFTNDLLTAFYEAVNRRIAREIRAGRLRRMVPMRACRSLVFTLYGHAVNRYVFHMDRSKIFKMCDEDVRTYVEIWLRGTISDASEHTHSK